jgi:hypothetical protein
MRPNGWKAGLARASVPLVLLAALGLAFSTHGSDGNANASVPCLTGSAARPAALPAGFPVPDGTVFRSTSRRHGHAVITARVPGGLRAARDFYLRALPAAGYRLGAGDAERYEAETVFGGHGVSGRLKLNVLPGCGGLALAIAVR